MSKDFTSHTGATQYFARATSDEGEIEDAFPIAITRAILRGGQIVIDWPEFDGEKTLTVLTKAQGKQVLRGVGLGVSRRRMRQTAVVEAVLYSNELGDAPVGEERWSGGEADWFVVQLSAEPFV